jgi:hypothetical protein
MSSARPAIGRLGAGPVVGAVNGLVDVPAPPYAGPVLTTSLHAPARYLLCPFIGQLRWQAIWDDWRPEQKVPLTSQFVRSPNGIRTRVATLRGWCPRPLDDGARGCDR